MGNRSVSKPGPSYHSCQQMASKWVCFPRQPLERCVLTPCLSAGCVCLWGHVGLGSRFNLPASVTLSKLLTFFPLEKIPLCPAVSPQMSHLPGSNRSIYVMLLLRFSSFSHMILIRKTVNCLD